MHLHIEPSVLYFGTPVALITTLDDDGDTNITPISSAWALGRTYVLGIGDDSHGLANLRRDPGIVINLPEASLAHRVEAIAATTGAAALSPRKAGAYRTEKDKWGLGGFTPSPAELVGPMRIVECPVQIEARVERIVPCDDEASAVHARRDRGDGREGRRGHPDGLDRAGRLRRDAGVEGDAEQGPLAAGTAQQGAEALAAGDLVRGEGEANHAPIVIPV